MAGARAAAATSPRSSSSSGNQPPQEPGLGELLEEFSRTQYRAKDCSGTGGSKVSRRRDEQEKVPGMGSYSGKADVRGQRKEQKGRLQGQDLESKGRV